MLDFKELFVYYDNVLAFYWLFDINNLVENNQQRIELMFDMDKIILNMNLGMG